MPNPKKIKPQSFHIIDESVKQNCKSAIDAVEIGAGYLVNIKSANESRSDAQSSLRWRWMGYLAKKLAGVGSGGNSEEWDVFFKCKFLRALAVAQDERHAKWYRNADELITIARQNNCESGAMGLITGGMHTAWLSVKNMQEYLTQVEYYCNTELEIRFPIYEHLKWVSDIQRGKPLKE